MAEPNNSRKRADHLFEVSQQAPNLLVVAVVDCTWRSHRFAGIDNHQVDAFILDELK